MDGRRELVIVGSGIAGLNALVVAAGYLSPTDRVVLVDSRPRAGGMWVDTYEFVRLHQPYSIFTAGDIAWKLSAPPSHLASRQEVLDHLAHCVGVVRAKVDLEERFGWEYVEHAEADGEVSVKLRGPDGKSETLRTKRLIKAFGNHVLPSAPLPLSSEAVRSTTPEQLTGLLATSSDEDGPVWIIGSGKTAMDVTLMLRRDCPGRSLNMISGSGTIFSRRETFFPTGARRWYGGTRVNAMFREAALRFDGANEHEVAAWFADAYGICPAGSSGNFFSAYLSDAECAEVRAGLDRIEPGHLDDVADTGEGPVLCLREGKTLPILPGSWVVNCTGYLVRPRGAYEPFVSETGNVLSIQLRSSVTGPFTTFAGYYLTHLMFMGRLRDAGLYELDIEELGTMSRQAIIWASMSLTMYNLGRIIRLLPPEVVAQCGLDFDRWYPKLRQLAGAAMFLISSKGESAHHRQTLKTLSERFGVRCGRLS
ncbi:MAG: hypothetical protein R3C30_09785 [Hyphomonadaceae bacterium]